MDVLIGAPIGGVQHLTEGFLRSLGEHTHVPFRVLLVDTSPQQGKPAYDYELLKSWFNRPDIRLDQVVLGGERNLHVAWNAILSDQPYDVVGVFNDDIVIGHKAVDHCVAAIQQHDLAACYPLHSRFELPVDFHERARKLGEQPVMLQGPDEFRGFAFFLHRRLVETVGLFDEQLRFYYGEDDYWWRLLLAGFHAREVGTALVHHYQQGSTSKLSVDDKSYSEWYTRETSTDAGRFEKKWGQGVNLQTIRQRVQEKYR